MSRQGPDRSLAAPDPTAIAADTEGRLAHWAMRCTDWARSWFPDPYVFAVAAVLVAAVAAMAIGAPPALVARSFGDGFWSLIVFTMQMVMVAVGGYVVASAPPAARLIAALARMPRTGRGAVALVATVSILASLLNWAVSLIFSGLLVRALARQSTLRMDYRAAGAAAYLGLGATFTLGLSSSAALLQANPASLPKPLLAITGVIPFSETIFLWQSGVLALALALVSVVVAWRSAPGSGAAVTAEMLGVEISPERYDVPMAQRRPVEWLEHSPLLTLILVALGGGWLAQEFARVGALRVMSNLNAYNLLFLTLGLLLHWRPRSFLDAAARAVPGTTGVLIQFPLYGGIAAILTGAVGVSGVSLADLLARAFVDASSAASFPIMMGVYSAVVGLFIPSAGGKWVIEAPYVMAAANTLRVHLGWAVQVYNAAEALPNLVNPFWMLPLLGVLGLRARDIAGFTFLQFCIHVPLVLLLLWLLAGTLSYHVPIRP